jgi:4-hydroxybenzoate polyprenyltransferase
MLRPLKSILAMIRFSHTLFALPFGLLAAVMAWTAPAVGDLRVDFRWRHLLGILICMVGARSAAMAFNRLADRHLDAQNPRTSGRHLPAGILAVRHVAVFTAGASGVFIAGTLLFLPNPLPVLGALPVLAFLFGYSYAKRFTALAHFWLGAALMLAPVCAWVALRGEVVLRYPIDLLPAAILAAAVLLWVAGFDMIYACQDVEFDVRARLRSVPARLGVKGALRLAAACHAGMVLFLGVLPVAASQLGLGWIYGSGIVAVAILLIYEHSLITPDDFTQVNRAFFHVNAVVSIGLFVVGTVDLLT